MSKSVLCAVDIADGNVDSPVLRQAARIAEMDGAQLDVVTVVPDYGDSWVATFFEADHHKKVVEAAGETLRELGANVLGTERNASVRHIVTTGKAYDQILETAKNAGSDLIVIGAHKPDLKDYILGPNAARVASHAPCSVFVVRP